MCEVKSVSGHCSGHVATASEVEFCSVFDPVRQSREAANELRATGAPRSESRLMAVLC